MNEQLLSYITQLQNTGIPRDNIRANLIQAGWPESAVDEALSSFSAPLLPTAPIGNSPDNPAPITPVTPTSTNVSPVQNPGPSLPSSSGRAKKVIFAICGLVLIAAGVGAYFRYASSGSLKNLPLTKQSPSISTTALTPSSSPLASNSAARQAFEKLREANNKKDAEAMKQYESKSTLEIVNGPQVTTTFYKDMEYVSEKAEGTTVVVTLNLVNEASKKQPAEFVFIQEDGAWKWDMPASMNRVTSSSSTNQPSGSSGQTGSLADLTVTGATTHPNPPQLSNPDTSIEFTVKNNGAQAVQNAVLETSLFLGENNKYLGSDGSAPDTILPGASKTYSYDWSHINQERHLTATGSSTTPRYTTAGKIPFSFTVNGDHAVPESNYDNNKLALEIEFVK